MAPAEEFPTPAGAPAAAGEVAAVEATGPANSAKDEEEARWLSMSAQADEEAWDDPEEGAMNSSLSETWQDLALREQEASRSLEELIAQIPDSTKQALDHYLRGKFVAVRKLDRSRLT